MNYGAALTEPHTAALDWFAAHAGKTVPWAALNKGEQLLAIIPKGIYRPKGWRHSLSIKIIPGGGYPDEVPQLQGGALRFRYHQETPSGVNPATFPTNEGLANCIADGVPVGVIRRLNPKPSARYEVLGLGRVLDWRDGFFTIELLGGGAGQAASAGESIGASGPVADAPPVSLLDARQKIAQAIVRRRGQAKFRAALLKAYQGRCVVSQCDVAAVLEAAHIKPYLGDHTNVVQNGLLLRADLHTLFDLKLLSIDPQTRKVALAESLKDTEYWPYHGQVIAAPSLAADGPALDCLEYAWNASAVL
jgi:putative restriction endonuclease